MSKWTVYAPTQGCRVHPTHMLASLIGQNALELLLVRFGALAVDLRARFAIQVAESLDYEMAHADTERIIQEAIDKKLVLAELSRDVANHMEYLAHSGALVARLASGCDAPHARITIALVCVSGILVELGTDVFSESLAESRGLRMPRDIATLLMAMFLACEFIILCIESMKI